MALVLALAKLGHAIELWINNQQLSNACRSAETRIKVKGVNDEIDPSVIMFAYAHPAVQRRLMFAVAEGYPGKAVLASRDGQPDAYPLRRDCRKGRLSSRIFAPTGMCPNADEFPPQVPRRARATG